MLGKFVEEGLDEVRLEHRHSNFYHAAGLGVAPEMDIY